MKCYISRHQYPDGKVLYSASVNPGEYHCLFMSGFDSIESAQQIFNQIWQLISPVVLEFILPSDDA